MKLTIGIFAKFDERWDSEAMVVKKTIVYELKDWCNEQGIEYYKKEGTIFISHRDVFLLPEEQITPAQLIEGMISGLRAKQVEIQAEAQAQVTAISAKINDMLAIEDSSTKKQSSFAPRQAPADITDVYDQGAPDDIPF